MSEQTSPVSRPGTADDARNNRVADNARTLVEAPSDKGFTIGLYLEHLDEASFLYEQRLVLLDDPELTWLDLRDFEERFEAHVDALTLGGDLALAACKQQAEEGDVGELHAASRVFCRQNRSDLVSALMDMLDPDDDERCSAVTDALCHEVLTELLRDFVQKLPEAHPAFTGMAVRAIGYQQLRIADDFETALLQHDPDAIHDVVWALGRIRHSGARSALYNTYLQHENEDVRAAAALALLRIGEPAALQYCAGVARSESWALLPMGLAGSRSHVKLLVDIAASEAVSPECMIALGLLGDASGIEPLLYHLGDARLAEAAATGLYLITGAPLFEDIFIPEAVDEDELFEDEQEPMEYADADSPPSDEPRGTTISRLSQQAETWQEWWRQNQAAFERGMRYRNGVLYAPSGLLENLSAEQSPRLVRQLAAEELVTRYGCDVPFETDMLVARQLEALTDIEEWLDGRAGRFTPGRWYVAGRIASS